MDWYSRNKPFTPQLLKKPWAERPSIYQLILQGKDFPLTSVSPIKPSYARTVYKKLDACLAAPNDLSFHLFYLSLQASTLSYIDRFLKILVQKRAFQAEQLSPLASFLLHESPDMEAVKFAIALLGLLANPDLPVLMTLGKCEDLSGFVAAVLCQVKREDLLFDLAKSVHGWGRIHTVQRLLTTNDPIIKDWLLREGFRNSIHNAYLAYGCASHCGLVERMREGPLDEGFFAAASDLIYALLNPMAGPGIHHYREGPELIKHYLKQAEGRPTSAHRPVLTAIVHFLKIEKHWPNRSSLLKQLDP